jgi:small neutral amino acid transporter SnatA (MarC family)
MAKIREWPPSDAAAGQSRSASPPRGSGEIQLSREAKAMEFESVDAAWVIDIFLLLLIGIGPKIALVPFLEVTADMPAATRSRVVRKMLTTATSVAILLLVLGGLLTRLLHFSPGALGVSSGIILLIIAVSMVLGPRDPDRENSSLTSQDPMRLAVFPLAVPYLLNPAGIVVLVTVSAEAGSAGVFGVVIGALVVVIAIDVAVFRWANRLSEHLNENRMLVTEKVFGFLLAALAVQLALDGLSDLGVIHLVAH